MKNKKVFIISFNQLSINFWEEHINLETSQVWHWKTPQHGIDNLTTVWPDVIIIDAYWAKEPLKPFLEKLLQKNSNARIFCVTPNKNVYKKTIFINKKLSFSNLNYNLFDEINTIISPSAFNDLGMEKTA